MARKRKLSIAPPPEAAEPGISAPAAERTAQLGGQWGATALHMAQGRLETFSHLITEGIMNGTVALEVPPEQLRDATGSDRTGSWYDAGEMMSLIADIRNRGQRQAIRIRPEDPSWRPSKADPFDLSAAAFIIQSGRRRWLACRQLGLRVLAVLSADGERPGHDPEIHALDLEERFLENTMRKDLSPFEQLLSIGMIARARPRLEQRIIAERLQVSPSDVSLGIGCLELRAVLEEHYDPDHMAKRDFRMLIPKLKKQRAVEAGEMLILSPDVAEVQAEQAPAGRRQKAVPAAVPPRIESRIGKTLVTAQTRRQVTTIQIKSWKADQAQLETIIRKITEELAGNS